MDAHRKLAKWAGLFISAQSESPADKSPAGQAESAAKVLYPGVTPAAGELLQAIDAGGVPAFVTSNLKQIARDNAIDVTDLWTPNEIVDALRSKASEAP